LPVQVQLKRRPAGVDAVLQHITQRLPQRSNLLVAQARDRPQWVDLGPPQRRLHVHIPDAGEAVLVQ